MAELLIGCGARRVKDVRIGNNAEWSELVTLDINPEHKPDLIHDLHDIPLPFPDGRFDEIHAYEVLEHVGGPGRLQVLLRAVRRLLAHPQTE